MATPEDNKNPSITEEKKESKPSSLNPKAVPYQLKPKKDPPPEKKSAEPAAAPPTINADAKPFVPKAKKEAEAMPEVPAPPEPVYMDPATAAQYGGAPPAAAGYYGEYQGEEPLMDDYMIDLLEDVSDEMEDNILNDWVKECQDCPCCKGWVYSCNGEACKNMQMCYCKVKMDIEENEAKAKGEELKSK